MYFTVDEREDGSGLLLQANTARVGPWILGLSLLRHLPRPCSPCFNSTGRRLETIGRGRIKMDQILMFSLFSYLLLVLFLSFFLTLGSFNAEMATLGFGSVPRSLKGPHG